MWNNCLRIINQHQLLNNRFKQRLKTGIIDSIIQRDIYIIILPFLHTLILILNLEALVQFR